MQLETPPFGNSQVLFGQMRRWYADTTSDVGALQDAGLPTSLDP